MRWINRSAEIEWTIDKNWTSWPNRRKNTCWAYSCSPNKNYKEKLLFKDLFFGEDNAPPVHKSEISAIPSQKWSGRYWNDQQIEPFNWSIFMDTLNPRFWKLTVNWENWKKGVGNLDSDVVRNLFENRNRLKMMFKSYWRKDLFSRDLIWVRNAVLFDACSELSITIQRNLTACI